MGVDSPSFPAGVAHRIAPAHRGRAPRRSLPLVLLDPSHRQPLHVQLHDALRRAIAGGRVAPGTRIPSSRALAEQLHIARNTAVRALQQLLDEGYTVTRHGAGTFVADRMPESMLEAPRQARPARQSVSSAALSRRGAAISSANRMLLEGRPKGSAPFVLGTPALDAFPAEVWGRLLHRRWQRSSAALVRPPTPLGYMPLRRAVADYLLDARGVRCSPEQVVIVSGSQQSLRIVLDLVLDPGERVWIEDPGPVLARRTVAAAGGVPVPVPVDEDGLITEIGEVLAPGARLALVAPQSQFPLLATMSAGRRRRLLAWARRAGAWILEDDRDSEFRYSGRPLPALQADDTDGRVIYSGTFSRALGPSLRIGYLVVPERLVDAAAAARALLDAGAPPLEQSVLADFLADGHFTRHLRRIRRLYEERQHLLMAAAGEDLHDRLELRPASSGMHLVGWLHPGAGDTAAAARALAAGILVQPMSMFRHKPGRPGLLLGYSALLPRQIAEGVRALAAVL